MKLSTAKKSIFSSKLDISNREISGPQFAFQQKNSPQNSKDFAPGLLTNRSELVLKKPVATKKTTSTPEKVEKIRTEKTVTTIVDKKLTKKFSRKKTDIETSMIANKVFKILEKKIAIEKERRGWI